MYIGEQMFRVAFKWRQKKEEDYILTIRIVQDVYVSELFAVRAEENVLE